MAPLFRRIIPILFVSDLRAERDFYLRLGFRVTYEGPEYPYFLVLGHGARVPSRNAIITNYGVGETAAKHALHVLVAEGLIEARPGSGCYVRRAPAAAYLEHDRPQFPGSPFGVDETVALSGDEDSHEPAMTRRLTWEHQTTQGPATPAVAARLGLPPAAAVVTTSYLMRADGEPVH